MSYILEALKKSEQERELGQVPGLVTAQEQEAPSRPRWLFPLAAVLLANGLLLGWLLLDRQDDPVTQMMGDAEQLELVAAQPPMDATPDLVLTQIPTMPELGPEIVLQNKPVHRPRAVVVPEPKISRPAPAPKPEVKPSAGGTVVFSDRNLDEYGDEPGDESGIDLDGTVPASEWSEDKVVNKIPLWREMSSSFRQSLPRISMDVHVYAEESTSRFVLVNLKKYREGDALETGTQIEEITSDGMVLNHDGERFRVKKQ